MGTYIANGCNFYENSDSYMLYAEECNEGQSQFNEDARSLQPIRHEAGEAILSQGSDKELKKISKQLKKAAKEVEAEYEDRSRECEESFDDVSCGYAFAYEQYVAALGPLSSFSFPTTPATSGELKIKNFGYLALDLENKPSSEVFLDTGADFPVFTDSFYLGNKDHFPGMDVDQMQLNVGLIEGLKLDVGGQHFQPKIGCVFPPLEPTFGIGAAEKGHSLAGIMGIDFMIRHPFEVDYDESTMTFDVDARERVSDGTWARMPMRLDQSDMTAYTISVTVYVNGEPMNLFIDTGAFNSFVFESCSSIFEGNIVNSDTPRASIYGLSTDAVEDAEISLGDESVTTKLFIYPDSHPHIQSTKELSDTCGALGADVLFHLDYIVDPNTMSLFFRERQSEFDHVEDMPDFGAKITKRNGAFVLKNVAEDGMFGKAGLENDDILIEFGGEEMSGMGKMGIIDTYFGAGSEIPVIFNRDGVIYGATLKKDG